MTARESLRDSDDKKNPGEEGYGSLQGRATASYSPDMSRSMPPFTSTQHYCLSAAPVWLLRSEHKLQQMSLCFHSLVHCPRVCAQVKEQ